MTPEQLCERADAEYLWTDERWRLLPFPEPTGLPAIVILRPREHVAEIGDLPLTLAAERGPVLGRVERALFVALWDDVLPRQPEEVWRANLDRIAATLSAAR